LWIIVVVCTLIRQRNIAGVSQTKGVVMRTSVKTIGSFSVLVMTVALAFAPVAFAQGRSTGAGGGLSAPANPTVPPSLGASPGAQAPVGHFQPRRDPALGDQPYQASAEEKALDRKIKSICRGC
jgi:hypothetical protein